MSFWSFANPTRFLAVTALPMRAAFWIAGLCLAGGLIWGFFFTPDDYRQGATVKIITCTCPLRCWRSMRGS